MGNIAKKYQCIKEVLKYKKNIWRHKYIVGSNLSINMFSPWARDFIRIASVNSAVKWVQGGDNLVKGVQCYELFGGIALKNHTFSFSFVLSTIKYYYIVKCAEIS